MSVPVVQPSMCITFRGVRAGVSTREGGVSKGAYGLNTSFSVGDDAEAVRQNRALFLGQLGLAEHQLAIPKQVHSARIALAAHPGTYPECDALLTAERGLALSISIADCVPVILYDPVHHACAIVHAGWRGSAERVTEQMVERMRAEFGSDPTELAAYVGHAAGPCCYEVGEEVAARFRDEVRERRGGGWYVDLKSENRLALRRAGLRPERVEIAAACTICTPTLHSYRRDRELSGRMMAVVYLAGETGE